MSTKQNPVDPVTVEIVGNLMLSIAEETCLSIIKSAYSTNIKERRDVSAAVVGPEGDLVAQADYLPIHLNAFLTFIPYIYQHFDRAKIRPGDMFIGNDPYHGGGNHLPDIVVAMPVFGNGAIIGWVVNMAHHSDIGGMVPGSTSSYADSIFQEGIRIPVIRICNEGKLQYYSERRLRAAIASVADGVYSYTDYLDDGGDNSPDPQTISVDIRITGDSIVFDFSKTCKQLKAPLNISYNTLLASCFYSLKALFGADIPATSGIFRVFEVVAPKGSLVNPIDPAPLGLTINAAQRLPDVIFGALAEVASERVLAGCNSTCQTTVFTREDPRHPGNTLICHEAIAGGSGASKHADGLSAVQVHMTNTSNMPIEAMETEFPILMIKKYSLRTDSGGAGEFRGGLGIDREFEMLLDGIQCKATGDRQKFAPYGLEGGKDGATGAFYREMDGKRTRLPGKSTGNRMEKGELLIALTPGSGGYGDPLRRPPEKVLDDVADGYVSVEAARDQYKVAINRDSDGICTLDMEATRALRTAVR